MIVLLTDFSNSEYVGIVKGVIYSLFCEAKVIDLSHEIKTVRQGAWVLLQSYRFFPKKTIFLCVVDPGVGSGRKPIIIYTKDYVFVGPDNGLLFPAAASDGIIKTNEIIQKESISSTFHGRDVFAPAAGLLELGKNPEARKLDKITELHFKLDDRKGEIVHIDSFGNIITNIPHTGAESYFASAKGFSEHLLFHRTYAEAKEDELFLIEGSSKTLEISLKGKDAARKTKRKLGMEIEIR